MKEYDRQKFEKLSFSNETYVDYKFTDCEFVDCVIESCCFQHCTFMDCIFTKCRLSNNKAIKKSQMRYSKFTDCYLIGVNWNEWLPEIKFYQPFDEMKNCRLKYNNFMEFNLSKFNFVGNDIASSLFADCKLISSNFNHCNLNQTEFFRCDLTKADFRDAVGYQISIQTNKLTDARFSFPDVMNLLSGLGIKID